LVPGLHSRLRGNERKNYSRGGFFNSFLACPATPRAATATALFSAGVIAAVAGFAAPDLPGR